MVKIFFIIILSSWVFADLQYLEKDIVDQTSFESVSTDFYADTHTSSAEYDDAIDEEVAIGFDFPFNGSSYSALNIDTNGHLAFVDITSEYTNNELPRDNRDQSIYPYWDDMNPAKGGSITYGKIGTGDEEHFVISWENVPHYPDDGSYSFQVVLYKDGGIRFRYDAGSNTDGSSATIGVQENENNYDQHSYNSTALDETKDILYRSFMAKLSMRKSSCVINDPVNGSTYPKRIPGAKIRYAIEISNSGNAEASDVLVSDSINSSFSESSIENLQIQNGVCDCLGVSSMSNNGANGSSNGENPVKLDFETLAVGTESSPTTECGYFEVILQ